MASTRFVTCSCAFVSLVACGSGGGFPDAKVIDAPPPGGRFSLAWTVTGSDGTPVTCEQIGASSVSITFHDPTVAGGNAEAFTCSSGMGTSEVLANGTYNMTVSLVANSGSDLVDLPPQMGVAITPGVTTALAPAVFAVDATGNLKLHIASLQPGGNCGLKANGGAGITGTTITLNNGSDNSCAPVTFAVGSGSAGSASTYTVDCAAPVVGPCFEADQELAALGIPSGAYQIHINGFEAVGSGSGSGSGTGLGSAGPGDCWTNNDTFNVPSAGADQNYPATYGQTHAPGC